MDNEPQIEREDSQTTTAEPTTTSKLDLARESMSWESPEEIKPHRGAIWYTAFGLISIGLTATAVFIGNISFAVLMVVIIIAVIIIHVLPPRIINYSISPKGVYTGDRLHDYSEFRSFGIQQREGLFSVVLMPVKRFSLSTSLYFPEDKGEKIIDMLGARLPLQEIKLDSLDKFIRLIKL